MAYYTIFNCAIGRLFIVCDQNKITHLFIAGQKHFNSDVVAGSIKDDDNPVLKRAVKWLEGYFKGEKLSPLDLPLSPLGSSFQMLVWDILLKIPYGQTMTYGEIAKVVAEKTGKAKMSAQAIGGAVSKNPISIIIPCHRVVGKNGLIGYDGGLDKKIFLLNLEKIHNK